MSLRTEHGLTIRQVNTVLKAIAALKVQRTERQIKELPPAVLERVNELQKKHDQGKCSCFATKPTNCKNVRQRIFNKALNKLPSLLVPEFEPSEFRAYSAYADGNQPMSSKDAEDIELRAIRCALAKNLCPELVRPLKGTRPDRADESEGWARTAPEGTHVISEGADEELKDFDQPFIEKGKTRSQNKEASDWVKEALRHAQDRGKSPAYSRVEAQFDDLFGTQEGLQKKSFT